MKEYQFKYTSISQSLFVGLTAIIMAMLTCFLVAYIKLNILWVLVSTLVVGVGLFRLLRGNAIHDCTAELGEASISFEFEKSAKIFDFAALTSYKSYYGKNGPILYLKTKDESFKLCANDNFCKTDDFKIFCDDAIAQLDKYRTTNHDATLIHEGSVFTKKSTLYVLVAITIIYLAAFFFETKTARISVGLIGGFLLLIYWSIYFSKNNLD